MMRGNEQGRPQRHCIHQFALYPTFDIARQEGATLLTVTHDHRLLERFERVIDFESFGDAR